MKTVVIIGMGMSDADLTEHHRCLIQQADVLVGGKRHLACFPESAAEKKPITKNLDSLISFIRQRMQKARIVVLASGDPLFFGIGTRLSQALGPERVEIYPNVSSLAAASARIKESWEDAVAVSLHGRKNTNVLLDALASADKVAVLTDAKHHPARLMSLCRQGGWAKFNMCVFEQLGTESERIQWFGPTDDLAGVEFQEPNLVVFKRSDDSPAPPAAPHLGMAEDAFAHQRGLITKAEVRVVSLAKLALRSDQTLWDIGSGSGSISVEASLIVKTGRIIAIEKDSERAAQIRENLKRFGVKNGDVLLGAAPECLAQLPAPHRIFIGGGGQGLTRIIRAADRHLRPQGRIVINTVLIPNLERAVATLQALGYQTDAVQIQINRSRAMPWGSRLEAENPVWIVTGEKDA
jgi:precorrin-6Y C5,15-methyltransferase (decarboxylating)